MITDKHMIIWDVRMESDGVLAVEICQDGSGTYYAGITSQGRVNDGGFHHVVINRWGTNICLFIDGGLDTEVSLSGIANIQNATALTAGRSACTSVDGTGYFVGILDEIELWQGDNSPWASSRNWPPSQYYNLRNPTTPWTNGVRVDSTNAARLAYNYLEADGSANLNGGQGAVRFWFNPDWNGGTGPGAPGYLFELGDVYAPGGGWALETDPSGTGLSFVSGSNGVLTTYLTAPISGWVSNSWHQIVLSYSTNQTLFFIDGGLATNGPGLLFEPDLATRLADGFTVGSDHNGAGQAGGVLDELATFNCPLAQSDVIAGYPKPAILAQPVSVTVNNGSTAFFTVVADSATTLTNQWKLNGANLTASDRVTGVTTNYTGTATNLLTVADVSDADTNVYTVVLSNSVGTLTSANAVLTVNDTAQLGLWLFTTTTWAGQQGQLPTTAANVSPAPAWSTNGVRMDTNVAARLVYRDVETNGAANLNCRVGSVVLWFDPDWSSANAGGSGPGNDGRFLELGTNGTEWWALCLDSRGTNLSFCTETNGSLTTNATAAVSWTNHTWHQVAATYGSDGVRLYVDGGAASYGTLTPVTKWPRRWGRDQGMAVGSDNATGLLQIRGVLADLETYNYELSGDDMADNYSAIALGGINYSGWFTNQFTRFSSANAGINGPPSASMAILVNSTSLASATWIPFNPNPSVSLGTGNGTRTVNFYFQALNGMISWLPIRITVDTNPPVLNVTVPGPGTNTVNEPVLQLQGFSPKQLSLISCDVSNAAGALTNLAVLTVDRYFDTNLGQFTTNYFEALDLGLTNGTNRITVHATDLAGNVTTTNFSYNLDYTGKSNPVLQLYWPTNGAVISGTNFTWRGSVDDPTVTLSGQIVDTNGDTNLIGGVVERNGNFWLEGVPLAGGTNWLTLTATDGAGNVTTTNILVAQSGVGLSITYVDVITNQTTVSVSGTLDTGGYKVWVNGVAATQSGSAPAISWAASAVPVNGYGTAVIEALAITNTDNSGNGLANGGNGTNSSLANAGNPTPHAVSPVAQAAPDKLSYIVYTEYHQTSSTAGDGQVSTANGNNAVYTWIEDWALGVGGSSLLTTWDSENDGLVPSGDGFTWHAELWDALGDGVATNGWSTTDGDYTSNNSGSGGWVNDSFILGAASAGSVADYDGATEVADDPWWDPDPDDYDAGSVSDHYMTGLAYIQGGKAVPVQYVVELSATASGAPGADWMSTSDYFIRWNQTWTDIPPTAITMAGGRLGADSIYHKVVPSGAPMFDITPNFDGGPGANNPATMYAETSGNASPQASYSRCYITYGVGANSYLVYIAAETAGNNTQLDILPQPRGQGYCVGQFVTFSLGCDTPDPWVSEWPYGIAEWSFSGQFYNSSSPTPGGSGNYPNRSYHFFLNSRLLELPVTTAWWISGGDGVHANVPANYTAATAQLIRFPNGQLNFVTPIGMFNMYRPVAKINALTTTPSVAPGAADTGQLSATIDFSTSVAYPPLGGSKCWIQILTDSGTEATIQIPSGQYHNVQPGPGPNFLDVESGQPFIPYDAPTDTDAHGDPTDKPGVPLRSVYDWVKVSMSFMMTMMYVPPGVSVPSDNSFWDGNGIVVPIRAVNWQWAATAVNDKSVGTWSITPSTVNITPKPGNTGTDFDTKIYPEWKSPANYNTWSKIQ